MAPRDAQFGAHVAELKSSPPRLIRLGFVGGAGSFIGTVHRSAILLSNRFAIAAGCFSSDRARSRQTGMEFGVSPDRIYDDCEQMAEMEAHRPDGIDAAVVLTPNGSHYEVVTAFMRRNMHIVCEKPVTTRLDHAKALVDLSRGSNRIFAVAHAYTGYATAHEARARVQSGSLGAVRIIQVEHAQSWLSSDIENSGHKIARQRTDPDINGAAGCVAAIGSHAANFASFVTGLDPEKISADLTTFVSGRRAPDNAHIMMRYANGARGMMWISQVAPGHHNGLRLRVIGDRGSLFRDQENSESLLVSPLGEPSLHLLRGAPGFMCPQDGLPAGHAEGFIGAFTRFYDAVGEQIAASIDGRAATAASAWVPSLLDGVKTVRFAEAALKSNEHDAAWKPVDG